VRRDSRRRYEKWIYLLALLTLFFAGCASKHPREDVYEEGFYHTVKRGETLYRISKTYNVPLQEIIRLNNIKDPARIEVGQRIFIPIPADSATYLIWPVDGVVTNGFKHKRGWLRRHHTGVDISAKKGTPIRAAASGVVVLSDKNPDGHSGYGKIIIIEHRGRVRTVYAHNKKNFVKEQDLVKRGQIIGEVGRTGRASGYHLHFEVREGKKPVDPLKYLK